MVERMFGVAKKHFFILWETNEYPMATQAKIVTACGVMHNFICTYDPEQVLEPGEPAVVDTSPADARAVYGTGNIGGPETSRASKQREEIVKTMWLAYHQELEKRGQVQHALNSLLKFLGVYIREN